MRAHPSMKKYRPAFPLHIISAAKTPSYYQEIAINRTVQAILQGKTADFSYDGDGQRQNGRGLPNLLEILEPAGIEPENTGRPKI